MKSKTFLLKSSPEELPTAIQFHAEANSIIIKQQCCDEHGNSKYTWQVVVFTPDMMLELWDLIDDHVDNDVIVEIQEENNVH